MDEQACKQWHCQMHHGCRGRGFHYSDSAIESALMLKSVLTLPLRALEGFVNSLFKLMDVPLQSTDYCCISKRAKQVNIQYRLPSKGAVAHLVIDATGLKVYGEGEESYASTARRSGESDYNPNEPADSKTARIFWALLAYDRKYNTRNDVTT